MSTPLPVAHLALTVPSPDGAASPPEAGVAAATADDRPVSPIAPDRINELYRGEIFADETAQVARERIHWMCARCEGRAVLDVGCSQGIASILLAREGFEVTAIDPHPESIAFARAEFTRESAAVQRRLTLLESDLESLPSQAMFDTILLGEVIEHQVRPDRLLAEAKARLRPGGRLVVTTPYGLHPHPDHKVSLFPADLVVLAERIGLGVADLEVEGDYMRCVMLAPDAAPTRLDAGALLRITQRATLWSQRQLHDRLAERSEQLKKKSDSLRVAQRKLADADARLATQTQAAEANAAKASAQLEALQSRHEQASAALAQAHEQELAAARHEALKAREASLNTLRADHQREIAALRAQLDSAQRELQSRPTPEALAGLEQRAAELQRAVDEAQAEQRSAAFTLDHERRQAREIQERLKALLNGARAEVKAIKSKNAYRLGDTLAIGMRSPAEMVALPGKILRLWREVRASRRARALLGAEDPLSDPRRDAASGPAAQPLAPRLETTEVGPRARGQRGADRRAMRSAAEPAATRAGRPGKAQQRAAQAAPGDLDIDCLRTMLASEGATAVHDRLLRARGRIDDEQLAYRMLQVGKEAADAGDGDAAFGFAQAALALCRSEKILRGFFWAAQRARRFEEACGAIRDLERLYGDHPKPEQQAVLNKLRTSPAYQLTALEFVVESPTQPLAGVPGRVAYVLHNSLPYSSGGYGTRSHGVATGLRAARHDVVVLTRPGFPLDIKPELTDRDVAAEDIVDGIRYLRTLDPQRKGLSMLQYVTGAADALEQRLREVRPQVVIAASNHVTALPALIAARRLGLPFVYEVRGLWEITRISREQQFGDTAAFVVQSLLEAKVAQLADHVFTLTEPMREELIARGVEPSHVDLLPNSCDPSRFVPRARDEALAERLRIPAGVPVIGYVGTFVDYEGLEDLTAACAQIKRRGVEFRLLLVGNENASGTDRGPITEEIVRIAVAEGLSAWLIMPGRVPHDEVGNYYSLIDVAPFPRKPWPVCEMVSPLKPLEALAMEKAVLVSDVRALAEMVRDGETGMHFRKGDIGSLADALQRLLADPDLRLRLGRDGRRWVSAERTWDSVGRRIADVLDRVAPRRPAASEALHADSANAPPWWDLVEPEFRARCAYVDVRAWVPSAYVETLRDAYVARFGEPAVAKRIPQANWLRADYCAAVADGPESLLDVGSGLGEFVNVCTLRRPQRPVTSVDVRDWDLWFDAQGRIDRRRGGLPALADELARDTVTCFEVVEHLSPQDLPAAIETLRRLARHRLLISVPFMEPLPLHSGHHTRFDARKLLEFFPDARFTVLGKGGRADAVAAWILCEIPGSSAKAAVTL